MPNSTKLSSKKTLLGIFGGLALLAVLVLGFLNRVAIVDTFKGLSYAPSPEIAQIESSLNLTPAGTRIFHATNPTLESRDDFNIHCESFNAEIAVLGCFSGDHVYVYNVEDPELAGIRESTTAHELLHAIWLRLPGVEKNRLVPLLESAYTANQSTLKDTIESYDESERLDELYVRAATQLYELPSELEAHYAKYFRDRTTILGFYDSYIAPFNELNAEIEAMSHEMETLRQTIDAKTADYEARSNSYNRAVDEFNACANTVGCFTDAAFYARRAELVAEQGNLDALYAELNNLINSYNDKVDSYNANVLHNNTLQSLINSNSKLENIE